MGDVTRLARLSLAPPYTLVLDIGCGHGLAEEALPGYARQVADWLAPGGLYLAYMLRAVPERQVGQDPEQVQALFSPYLTLEALEVGADEAAGAGSAWYWWRKG
ncbi:MAG: hypothetical protein HC915_09515 [Anaerolineae bacterium]|nr:hypothetical protein [Anaerolineae bacterium]